MIAHKHGNMFTYNIGLEK